MEVGLFTRTESIKYLVARSGIADEHGADQVAAELEDLPLALAQAATVIKLKGLSYPEYAERLRAFPLARMLPSDRGDAYAHSTAAAILLSIRSVSDADPTGLTGAVISAAAVLSAEGISRDVIDGILDGRSGETDLDDVLAGLVQTSLAVWAKDRGSIVMHRLVARAERDRLEAEGTLAERIKTTANGLRGILIDEQSAWQHRQEGAELVAHALAVWQSGVYATDRQAITPDALPPYAYLGAWAVRHLVATADLSRAIRAGHSVLADSERVLGPDHPDTLSSRNNLAYAYESAGQLEKAIPLFERTLADRERVLGPDHPDTLSSRNNLASAYESAGQLEKAIPLFERTLADRERVLGPDHPNTLSSRNNLASAYRSAGQLEKAIPLFERTLADRERVLGPDHPDTLSSRNNLASAYRVGRAAGEGDPAVRAHPRRQRTDAGR